MTEMTEALPLPRSGSGGPPLDAALADQLIREIIALDHPPGSWLREQEIAARFQISRSPVREALRHVARRGFVEIHPWRGAQVVAPTAAETRHVFDLLELMSGLVGRLAAESLPEERFLHLCTMLADGEVLLGGRAPREVRNAWSFKLVRSLARALDSRIAYDMLIYVGGLALWQHRYLAPDDVETMARQLDLHRAFVHAILARDAVTAEWAGRAMVAITRAEVMSRLASES